MPGARNRRFACAGYQTLRRYRQCDWSGHGAILISHPALIDRWIVARETALARVIEFSTPNAETIDQACSLLARARRHIAQTHVDDAVQANRNDQTYAELLALQRWLQSRCVDVAPPEQRLMSWSNLQTLVATHYSVETQELVNSILMECHPALVDPLEDDMATAQEWVTEPQTALTNLRDSIETHYGWALAYDFDDPSAQHYFWFLSENKEEPRLGKRGVDPGDEHEMALDIARAVCRCYDAVEKFLEQRPNARVVDFMLAAPECRWAVQRVQTMAHLPYGEIRANLIGTDFRPIDLLRCKLSFFGASKFDPRSDRWVRITLFQGAPLIEDLEADRASNIDWFLPENQA